MNNIDQSIQYALNTLRQPQHPDHVSQAAELLAGAGGSLDGMWNAFQVSRHAGAVWCIAAIAWHSFVGIREG